MLKQIYGSLSCVCEQVFDDDGQTQNWKQGKWKDDYLNESKE